MSAIIHAHIKCDGPDCTAVFGNDDQHKILLVKKIREIARNQHGWTYNTEKGDLCPEHKFKPKYAGRKFYLENYSVKPGKQHDRI